MGCCQTESTGTWLADTAALLGSAETYVLGTRLLHWTPDDYERWLLTTWKAMLGPPETRKN